MLIHCTEGQPITQSFLTLLCRIKGLKPAPGIVHDCQLDVAVEHRRVPIQGLWPCVDYLMRIRPYPNLNPDTPERCAVIHSLIDLIWFDPNNLDRVAPLYLDPDFLPFNHPCLLDLAVAAHTFSPFAPDRGWIANTARLLVPFTNPMDIRT